MLSRAASSPGAHGGLCGRSAGARLHSRAAQLLRLRRWKLRRWFLRGRGVCRLQLSRRLPKRGLGSRRRRSRQSPMNDCAAIRCSLRNALRGSACSSRFHASLFLPPGQSTSRPADSAMVHSNKRYLISSQGDAKLFRRLLHTALLNAIDDGMVPRAGRPHRRDARSLVRQALGRVGQAAMRRRRASLPLLGAIHTSCRPHRDRQS